MVHRPLSFSDQCIGDFRITHPAPISPITHGWERVPDWRSLQCLCGARREICLRQVERAASAAESRRHPFLCRRNSVFRPPPSAASNWIMSHSAVQNKYSQAVCLIAKCTRCRYASGANKILTCERVGRAIKVQNHGKWEPSITVLHKRVQSFNNILVQ